MTSIFGRESCFQSLNILSLTDSDSQLSTVTLAYSFRSLTWHSTYKTVSGGLIHWQKDKVIHSRFIAWIHRWLESIFKNHTKIYLISIYFKSIISPTLNDLNIDKNVGHNTKYCLISSNFCSWNRNLFIFHLT